MEIQSTITHRAIAQAIKNLIAKSADCTPAVSSDNIKISVYYNGKTISRKLTAQQIKMSYGKARERVLHGSQI
jgi:hypothetical protein